MVRRLWLLVPCDDRGERHEDECKEYDRKSEIDDKHRMLSYTN